MRSFLSFFIFFFVLSISSVSIAQNCDDYPVEIKDHDLTEITAQYKQIIEQYMGDNDTVMPSNFMEIARCYVLNIQEADIKKYSISLDFIQNRPDLVFLILNSRSLEKEEEKRSWFNLSPMMSPKQADKLFDILSREFIKIHQIEAKYERKKEEIAKTHENTDDYIVVDDSDKRDTTFKYLGALSKNTSNGTEKVLDEWFINPQGMAVSVSNGTIAPLDSVVFLSGPEFRDWESREPQRISCYEEFICRYLQNIQHGSASFPQGQLAQNTLYSCWDYLLKKYYRKPELLATFKKLASFPMENYVGNKRKVLAFRYNYLMLSKFRSCEYDDASDCLAIYLHNSDPVYDPSSFLFYLYATVLGNNNAGGSSSRADAEQEFVNWYERMDTTELSQNITRRKMNGTSFLMADYFLLYGTNDELKGIVKNLLNRFEQQLSLDNIQWSEGWYEYLNKMYFLDKFRNNYTMQELKDQLEQHNFLNDENWVEYATYYVLYKIKHISKDDYRTTEFQMSLNDILNDILSDAIRKCEYPLRTYFYCEKDILNDLKSRWTTITTQCLLASQVTLPEIDIVAWNSKSKEPKQKLLFVAKAPAGINTIKVIINGEEQTGKIIRDNVKETNPKNPNIKWEYSQTFNLKKNENTVIVKCKDVNGNEVADTVTVMYEPDNFMDRTDYAILFAVDDYSNVKRCGNLFKPIEDAEKFAKILAEEYGFDTLVVRNPTRKTINSIIKTYQYKEYGPFDQLLIFYAGHGYFDDFGLGYIVPSDGDIDDDDKLVDYASLAAKINGISCRHILFICDACHSGSFLAQQRASRPDIQMQNEVMKNKSRLFLGSCLAKDETPDKSAMMDKICKKLRDQDRDKPIDFYSLIGLTYTTGNTTEEKQKAFGEFGDHEIGGDFFFNKK